MLESRFQSRLIKEIERRFPGAVVLKIDPEFYLSFPDLVVLNDDRWAALESKRGTKAVEQPNQSYYVDLLDKMSFGRFINPMNKEVVLDEMDRLLFSKR